MSDQEPVKKKFKTVGGSKRFQYHWFDNYPSWKTWVKPIPNDNSKFFCKACKTVLSCGISEIRKHSERENHLQNLKKLNLDDELDLDYISKKLTNKTSSTDADKSKQHETTESLSSLREDFNFNERVKVAEIRVATFFVEKNVPFSIASDLLLLMKDIGNEQGILQAMTLGRAKLTQIVNNVVCRKETNRICKVLEENRFSIYETSDITNKRISLMVRYVDPKTLHIRCELLQVIYLNATDCSNSKMFESFKNELGKKNISLQLIVSLAHDNTSGVTSKNSSIVTKLSENNPNLITLPCVRHTSALIVKEACKIIPSDCERFIKHVFVFINDGVKKRGAFRDFISSFENSLTNLRYIETRWLTHHKCIQKILEMWSTLDTFLIKQLCTSKSTKDNRQDVNRIKKLHKSFRNPATKAYLLFLEFTLNPFNKYDVKFQARESLVHELQPSSMELLLWFLRKFIKPALLEPKISDDTIQNLNFSHRDNQLLLEEIDFGIKCKEYLKELDQKDCKQTDIDLIKKNFLQFYVTASEQIRKRLPVNDAFLHSVTVFENKTALFDCDRDSTFCKVLHVNQRLGTLVDEKLIENEWKSLYEIDFDTKVKWSELSFDNMWIQIGFFSTDKGDLHFPNLRLLLNVVRTFPHSNIEAERVSFLIPSSERRKKYNMSIETLNSICVVRYALKNSDSTARTMAVTRDHLSLMNTRYLYTYAHLKKNEVKAEK